MDATAQRPIIRIAALAATLLAGVTGSVLIAEPAAATIPGLVRVTHTSLPTASDKTVTVSCPFARHPAAASTCRPAHLALQ